MPIPRLTTSNCLLLVVDIQEAFEGHIHQFDRVKTNASVLGRMAGELAIPVLVTEHYPSGLGRTVPLLRAALPAGTPHFEKTKFSAAIPEVLHAIHRLGRPHVLLCGIEAHVCILQSSLDLLSAGLQAFHVTDAISAGQEGQIAPALRRMERAGAIPTGTLSCMYELMADAKHPAFKACLALAKQVVG